MTPLPIRLATTADVPAINDIYNHYVRTSTCTYQEEPDSGAERARWLARHDPEFHPVTVAEVEGKVVGWGSLSSFRERSAYRLTVENSVYVRHDLWRNGIGRALLADLIERSRRIGHRTIIAGIDAAQPGSIRLHRQFGFTDAGTLRQVGYKFGRWLDVVFMQLMLD